MERTAHWKEDHQNAMLYPSTHEWPLVLLLRIIPIMATQFGADHVQREAVASLIEGGMVLVHADWGKRLDREEMQLVLADMAKRIGYDLNAERFPEATLVVVDEDFPQRPAYG